ncbi:hypothetical protein [Moorena sp. SIO4G3]|uniref:hypothetical protein n=1 Tax=Moorena sp. SIO4G3 TaxID=2607821 RepID=UPI00142AD8CF|nr:hypothetical protein [Moorena sp. SIO4G3]NEO77953.1 hypothetical protein [Moorena sp. SIO4G3]
MANINVNDLSALNLTGAELFNDSESFMMELSNESEEIKSIYGGACCLFTGCNKKSCVIKREIAIQ